MNTNLTELNQLIQDCVNELRDEVEETVQREGSFCPSCLFEEWNEGNQTALMQRLYQLTKDNPEEAMVTLFQFARFNQVINNLAEHLAVTTLELNEPELCTISK